MKHAKVAFACSLVVALAGCATSRYDQLLSKAGRVESDLKKEQKKVLALEASDPARASKLDHLTSLRAQLSAANVGLSTVRHALPDDKKDIGYDVLDQVYDTIDWNIPLGPNDKGLKAMPRSFSSGVLRLD